MRLSLSKACLMKIFVPVGTFGYINHEDDTEDESYITSDDRPGLSGAVPSGLDSKSIHVASSFHDTEVASVNRTPKDGTALTVQCSNY